MNNNPPIPSPVPDPQESTPASTSKWHTYVPMFVCGVAMFGIFLAGSYFFDILPLSLIIITLYAITGLYATFQVKALGDKLHYVVGSQEELVAVRRVIDLNMKLAFLSAVVVHPLLIVAVVKGVWLCTLLLLAVSLLMSAFVLPIENKFKAMKVDAADPTVAPAFQHLVAQWKEPTFGLK